MVGHLGLPAEITCFMCKHKDVGWCGRREGEWFPQPPTHHPSLKGSLLLGEPVAGWQPSFPVAPEGLQTVPTLY